VLVSLLLATMAWAQMDQMAAESRRAKEMMAAGRFAEAVPIYEKLLQAMPSNAGLRLNLAMALHLSGNDQRAIPEFEAVLKQQPQALPALMLLSASYMRTGAPAKAAPLLEKALVQIPNDVEARSMLIDALLMLERESAAIPHLRKMTELQPQNPRVWYGLGRSYEAVSQGAFESLERQGPDSPWWLFLAGEARLKLGRNTAALTLFRAALEKQPSMRGAHARIAEVYRNTKHPDWAAIEEEREKKISAPPCTAATAECQFVQGRYQQALTLALQHKTGPALYWQCRSANELARQAFTRLAQLPPSAESHQVMAELYRNQGRHADAINEWKAALTLAPGDLHLREELATSVYLSKDYVEAATMAEILLVDDPKSPELQFILGDSLVNQQQLEKAIDPLKKAVALRPDYAAAHAVLGRVLLQTGQAEQSVAHLKAGLSEDTDGSLHFQLSRAYQAIGKPELAAEMLAAYQKIRKEAAGEDVSITPPQM